MVATLLGMLSSALAWQFTASLGERPDVLALARRPQRDLLVPLGALYSGHRLAVAAFPVRAPGTRARGAVHMPSVVLFSFTHIP